MIQIQLLIYLTIQILRVQWLRGRIEESSHANYPPTQCHTPPPLFSKVRLQLQYEYYFKLQFEVAYLPRIYHQCIPGTNVPLQPLLPGVNKVGFWLARFYLYKPKCYCVCNLRFSCQMLVMSLFTVGCEARWVLTYSRFGMPCYEETKYIVLMYGPLGFQKYIWEPQVTKEKFHSKIFLP